MVKEEEEDERFKQVLTDPRFKSIRRKNRKIKVDSRFKGMFDKKFNGRCVVDKRGKRIPKTTEKSLKKFYEVSDSDEQEDGDEEKERDEEGGEESQEDSDIEDDVKASDQESGDDDDGNEESEEDGNQQLIGKTNRNKDDYSEDEPVATTSGSLHEVKAGHGNKKVADLRGEHNDLVSSSSDEESSEEEGEEEDVDHEWGELDKDAPRGEDISNRLAVCNVDWDRIKAQDLFILFNSFKPASGEVTSVKIYPSQFGKERMKEEAIKGPKELTEVTISEDEDNLVQSSWKDDDNDIDDDNPMVLEKLRQYQINRLKYYYAVVECDTAETAASLYDQLDGMEYESSASTLDVRFIPDDVAFDEDEPSSECYEMPSLIDYKAPLFITTALQQSKVRLTWDETDPDRGRKFQKAFTDVEKAADDLAVYLASSSEEGDDDDDIDNRLDEENFSMDGVKSVKDKINKYKDLLQSIEQEKDDDDKDIDMEVTWQPELENIGKELIEKKKKENMSVFERERLEKKSKKGGMIESNESTKLEDSEEDEDDNEEADQFGGDEGSEDEDERNESEQEHDEAEKDALSLLVMDDQKDKKHFDYDDYIDNKKSKRKKKKDRIKTQDDNFKFDADDPRFAAIYKSHLYNVDQSSSHFKKTEAFEEILKRKSKIEPEEKATKRTKKEYDSLTNLIERAKAKTSQVSKWKKS